MTTTTMTPAARIKAIFGGSAGNLVEWYDWYVYSAFSLYFAKVFFPKGDQTAELLNAAAVFAVGFLMRPIGAWVMGLYADRYGRKKALTTSVGLMCFGSLVIAIVPGYQTIGVAAPVILVIVRMLQGLSLGGEYGASATYLSEVASKKNRGFWASFQYVTLISGQLIALAVLLVLQATMSDAALASWGWRIPFAIGAVLAVVVFWLRRNLHETEQFKAETMAPSERAKTMFLFVRHPKATLLVFGLTAGGSLAFYTYTTYIQKFLTNTAGFTKDQASQISAGALLVYMLLQPVYGALSDRIGRRPLLVGFGVLGMLATWPIMTALGAARDPWIAFALSLTALLIVSGYTSIAGLVKAEMFPVGVRALGVALPYAVANSMFGGTAEYAALWFKNGGNESGFYIYVTIMIGVALAAAVFMGDTRDTSLITED